MEEMREMVDKERKLRSVWGGCFVLAVVAVLSCSAFAIPIYVVDDYKISGVYSSQIIVMDSAAPHNETILNSGTGQRMTDIAITPSSGRLYTITGNDTGVSLYRYDPGTGNLLGSWDLGVSGTGFKNAMVAESETSLLFMSNTKTNIWQITLNGAGNYSSTADLGSVGLYSSGDLAYSPLDGTLYLSSVDTAGSGTARNRLYTIDTGTLLATEIGIIKTAGSNDLTQIFGLAFDENGVLYGGRGAAGVAEDVYTIDLTTAVATYGWTMQCKQPVGINGFASVPEPATILLLTLGAALIRIKRK